MNTMLVVGFGCWLLAEALDRLPDESRTITVISTILGIGGAAAVILSPFFG